MGTDTKGKTLRGTEVKIGLSVIGLLFAVLVGVVVMRFSGHAHPSTAQDKGLSGDDVLASGPSVPYDNTSNSPASSGPSRPMVLAAQANHEPVGYADAAAAADDPYAQDASQWHAGSDRYAAENGGAADSQTASTSHASQAEPHAVSNDQEDTTADSFEQPASYDDNAGGEVAAGKDSSAGRYGSEPAVQTHEASSNGLRNAAPQPIDGTPAQDVAESYSPGNGAAGEPALNAASGPVGNGYRGETNLVQAEAASNPSIRQPEPAPIQTASQQGYPSYNSSYAPIGGDIQASAQEQVAPNMQPAVRTDKTIVQPGDSLWTISRRIYGSGAFFKALQEHNRSRFPNTHDLKIGDEVLTPDVAVLRKKYPGLCPRARKRGQGTPVMANVSTRVTAGRTYVVEEGDTLYDIARYELGAGGRWPEIYQLNSQALGNDFDYLRPGTRLTLPAAAGAGRQDALTQQPDTFPR